MSHSSGMLDARAALRVPFRWAGGKQWLAPVLAHLTSELTGAHVEPFAGGASLFFKRGPVEAWLNDANGELMHAYATIRDSADAVSGHLEALTNDEPTYYLVRDSTTGDPAFRAARFVYLNRTSFGGLWRVNRRGYYNVPYGRRANAWIPDRDELRLVSEALQGTRLTALDFRAVLALVRPGTLVYLDPPYAPAAGPEIEFNRYTESPFGARDHEDLAILAAAAMVRGAHVFVSLSSRRVASLYSADLFNAFGRTVGRGLGNADGKQVESTELLLTPKWCRGVAPGWKPFELGAC